MNKKIKRIIVNIFKSIGNLFLLLSMIFLGLVLIEVFSEVPVIVALIFLILILLPWIQNRHHFK